MPLGPPSSAAYVKTPVTANPNPSRILPSVTVHPSVLFSILDHYLRRNDVQERVIGTLLGIRNEDSTVIEVKSCFAVLHREDSEQVAVDMEYHRTMFELHQRASPKEIIVGWYSTGSNLNTYSALIQNFYSQETTPHQAVHITMNTGTQEGEEPGVKAYISSPVGVFPKPENCVFIPVPITLSDQPAERSALTLLTSSESPITPQSDLSLIQSTLTDVLSMIDRVLAYVRRVLDGEIEGDKAVGKILLDALNTSTKGFEKGFNAHLQDTLMMNYLANLLRSQVELSSRMALIT